MKQIVLNTLDKLEIRKIAFGFGTIYINALSFESVKEAIKKDKIKVEYKSSLGANTAKYRYTANTLFLGFKDTGGSTDREALIVHECVHAIFDIAGKTMLVKQSEAAAYVTQVLYFYYRNESAILAGSTPTFKDPILKAAWDVAMIARRRSNITEKEVAPLYTAPNTIFIKKITTTMKSMMACERQILSSQVSSPSQEKAEREGR